MTTVVTKVPKTALSQSKVPGERPVQPQTAETIWSGMVYAYLTELFEQLTLSDVKNLAQRMGSYY